MLIDYSEKTCLDSSISSEILHLAGNNPQTKLKIIHNDQLDPFAYAIGFGCKTNSNLIVGGISDKDWFSSRLLITLASTLCLSSSQNNRILGFDINKIFKSKGLWIIPKFSDASNTTSAMNFIVEKLNPRQLIEIKPFGEKVKYYSPKSSETNTRLFSYLLAASCDYSIDNKDTSNDENNLCKWFCDELSRPSYNIMIGKYENFSSNDLEPIFNQLLESLLLFISS